MLQAMLGLVLAIVAQMAWCDARTRQHYILHGDTVWASTHLIEAEQGSLLSSKVASLIGGGFESAGGAWIGFDRWYYSRWPDARFTWMTQLSPRMGVIWGFSTGERAQKYRITPSAKVGVVLHLPLTRQTALSLRASTILGGRLRESSCSADYGEIGGVQEVNCRLAASILPPAETLRYLFNDKPFNRDVFFLQYVWRF